MYGLMEKYFDMGDPKNQKDLETILRAIPSYLDIMIMVTMYLCNAHKAGQTPKKITCRNIIALVQFSQNLMQRGFADRDPFQVLPYFEAEECKKLKSILPPGSTLYKYCLMSKLQR